jgi:hypothetical protein
MRRDTLESRANLGMRAYVTSGLVPTRAKRDRATASRHTVWASSRRATHGRREDLRRSTHHLVAAISGSGSGAAGDVCVLCRRHRLRWQRSGQRGDAKAPVVLTGTRLRNRSRARTPRRFRHPEVAPDAPILRQPQNRYAASDAASVRDRGNMTTMLGLLKNPALALKRCSPGHPSRDVFRQAILRMTNFDSAVSGTAKLLSGRLGDGHDCSPTSLDARAALKTHCAFLTRNALTARTKQYGLTSRSTGPKTQLSEACLCRPLWTARLWLATCTT